LDGLGINTRTVGRLILAVVWPFGYDFCCPRQTALNTLLNFGFRKP